MHYFWLLTLSSTIFISNFYMLSELHSLNIKLHSIGNSTIKKFLLHLIVAPQLSNGW
jgi:hypothetical protein